MRKLLIFGIGLLSFILNSCDLDINKDPNYPTEVSADKFFTSGQMWTASMVGGDLQLIGGMWAQHYAQNSGSNQYTNIDSYNIPNSSTYITRTWGAFYAGALPDYKLAMEKAEANGDWHYWMAAKIMTAYTYHVLVEAYGNVPLSQALDFDKYTTPVFDDAKTINQNIITMLDDAIAKSTDAAAKKSMGSNDFVFGGDIPSWVQFAKSLKLKIYMRDFAANQAAIQALLNEGDLLSTDAKITVYEDKENNSNPLYENDRRKLNTPNNIRASSTLALYLHQNNDPRAAAFMEKAATPSTTLGDYVGLPQGGYTLPASYSSTTSRALIKADDPVYFMSYAEVEFLKAEAYVKLSNPAAAKTAYDNGVTAAFDRWKGTSDVDGKNVVVPSNFDVSTFIGSGKPYEFNQTSTTTMLESIWRQSWIAATRSQEWNAFIEINRTGFPAYGTVNSQDPAYVIGQLAPSMNTVLNPGEFPKRLIYPKTSADYNSNTPISKITDKLWWQK